MQFFNFIYKLVNMLSSKRKRKTLLVIIIVIICIFSFTSKAFASTVVDSVIDTQSTIDIANYMKSQIDLQEYKFIKACINYYRNNDETFSDDIKHVCEVIVKNWPYVFICQEDYSHQFVSHNNNTLGWFDAFFYNPYSDFDESMVGYYLQGNLHLTDTTFSVLSGTYNLATSGANVPIRFDGYWGTSVKGTTKGTTITIPTFLYGYHSQEMIDFAHQVFNDEFDIGLSDDLLSYISVQIDDLETFISIQNGLIGEQTEAVEEQTEAIKEQTDFLKDNNIDDNGISTPTENNVDITSNGVNSVFNILYDSFTKDEVQEIIFPIPFANKNITIKSNFLSERLR